VLDERSVREATGRAHASRACFAIAPERIAPEPFHFEQSAGRDTPNHARKRASVIVSHSGSAGKSAFGTSGENLKPGIKKNGKDSGESSEESASIHAHNYKTEGRAKAVLPRQQRGLSR
jgi:hypothetical protein